MRVDALGHELVHARRLRRDRADLLDRERARQLVQQERVAAADVVADRGERLLGLLPEPLGEHHGSPVRAQRPRRQPLGLGIGRDPLEAVPRGTFAGPAGDREQHRQLLQAGHQEAEEVERGGVGPMRVVDREQQWLLLGERGRQPVEAVQHRERVGGRALVQAERATRGAGHAVEQLVPVGCGEPRSEQLPGDREREPLLQLGCPRGEHLHAGRADRPRARPAAGASCQGRPAPR